MRSVPRKVPPPSSAAFGGSNGHNHRGANNNNLGRGRGATAVTPLQVYLVGVSCAIVFMACIFFVADVSSFSSSFSSSHDDDGDASPRRRRRGRGGARRRDGKSPRQKGEYPSGIGHPPPTTTGGGSGGTSEEVLDDRHYSRPSSRVAAKPISSDGAHRLRRPKTGGILRRRGTATARAAPWRRNSDPMADNSRDDDDDDADANIHGDAQPPQSQCSIPADPSLGSGRPSSEGYSAGVVCRVIDHHPIARNRHRYNQRRGTALHPGRDSAPDAHVVPACGDDEVWASASLISVPNEPSLELFKHMNSQPLHRDSNAGPNDASDEITKSIACPLDTVDRTMGTDVNKQYAASTGTHFVDDKKENVVKRLGSNANDDKLKMNRGITAGKKSSRITIGKVDSAPANVASTRDYSSAIAIQNHVGNDDPARHNDGEDMHSSGHLAHVAKNKKGTERDSWNSVTNDVDWAPSNAESIPRENCFPLQESVRDSLPQTHPASQGAESVADMSGLAPAPAARLTVLISNGVYDYYQASHQKAALSLLGDLCIPHDVVDGNDPSQREKRDAFFGISDIRGNYPQIFLTSEAGDEHHFLGGYDWLDNVDFNYLKGISIVERNSSDKDETEHDTVDAKATKSQTNIKSQV